ncbi:MAG: HD-GYP domain-containing protein, partial [Limnochordia bacterium]
INKGVVLKESILQRLIQLGCPAVYVEDPLLEGLEIPEPIREETRQQAQNQLRRFFTQVHLGRWVNCSQIKGVVDKLIDELASNPRVLVGLTDIRTYDSYTFGHSVNVCLLSILTGMKMGFNELELRDLATGALLHDIGKTQINKQVLLKPGALTEGEYAHVQLHTTFGFEALRRIPDFSILVAHIAYQHHERLEGQGYPRGLRGDDLHTYARIVAVADSYDAMTADRIYRPGKEPKAAIQELQQMAGRYYDPQVVEIFCSNVAVYPVGTWVQLNSGYVGVVVDINASTPKRPVVRLLFDPQGRPMNSLQEVDLSMERELGITSTLSEVERETWQTYAVRRR